MTLLVHRNLEELFQLLVTHARFCLLYYILSSDSKAMRLIASSLLKSLFKTFNKKKLN